MVRQDVNPHGMDANKYGQLLNQFIEGANQDKLMKNHITRYICSVNPSDRTEAEKQMLSVNKRFCFITEVDDATQQKMIRETTQERLPDQPDMLPFHLDMVCRVPSEQWKHNIQMFMGNRTCNKSKVFVTIDTVRIRHKMHEDPEWIVFLLDDNRVDFSHQRNALNSIMYTFDEPVRIDTMSLMVKGGIKGAIVEARLKNNIVSRHTVSHNNQIVIVHFTHEKNTVESYERGKNTQTRCYGGCFLVILLCMVVIICVCVTHKKRV